MELSNSNIKKNIFQETETLKNSMFNHFFRYTYEINIFELNGSKDFYRALKKAVLKKISSKFFEKKKKDN